MGFSNYLGKLPRWRKRLRATFTIADISAEIACRAALQEGPDQAESAERRGPERQVAAALPLGRGRRPGRRASTLQGWLGLLCAALFERQFYLLGRLALDAVLAGGREGG